MKEKMNRKLLPLALVALFLILLSPVSAYADTGTMVMTSKGKTAMAAFGPIEIEPGLTQAFMIMAGESLTNLPGPPGLMKVMAIAIIRLTIDLRDPNNPIILFDLIYGKELTPSEFKWSFDACRVSTEIEVDGVSCPLIVEWYTEPPTLASHTIEYDGWRIVSNGAGRMGSATVVCGYDLLSIPETGWIGAVYSQGTITIMQAS